MIDRRSILLGAAKMLVFGSAAAAAVPAVHEATNSLSHSRDAPPDAIDALVSAFMRCAETNGVTIRLEYGRSRSGSVGVCFIEPDNDPRSVRFERVCASWAMLRSVPGARERFIAACDARINGGPHSQKGAVFQRHTVVELALL